MAPDIAAVKGYLMGLQDSICAGLEEAAGPGAYPRARGGGGPSRPDRW